MRLNNTFGLLDYFLKRWHKIDIEEESKRLAIRKEVKNIEDIFYDLHVINNKCSVLLTHISIMFVVLGLFIVSANHWIVNLLLSSELISYIIVASLVLRCLEISGHVGCTAEREPKAA